MAPEDKAELSKFSPKMSVSLSLVRLTVQRPPTDTHVHRGNSVLQLLPLGRRAVDPSFGRVLSVPGRLSRLCGYAGADWQDQDGHCG